MATEPDPLKTQVDGNHYKSLKIQPMEYAHANGLDFFQGNVVKYITRFRSKAGKKDLEKAKHFIEVLMKLEYPEQPAESAPAAGVPEPWKSREYTVDGVTYKTVPCDPASVAAGTGCGDCPTCAKVVAPRFVCRLPVPADGEGKVYFLGSSNEGRCFWTSGAECMEKADEFQSRLGVPLEMVQSDTCNAFHLREKRAIGGEVGVPEAAEELHFSDVWKNPWWLKHIAADGSPENTQLPGERLLYPTPAAAAEAICKISGLVQAMYHIHGTPHGYVVVYTQKMP